MRRSTNAHAVGSRAAGLPKRLVIAATSLAAIALAVVCVVAWIPVWPCMLFEHFRIQYVAAGLIVVGCAAALRLRGYFDLAAIVTLVHVLPVVGDLTASQRRDLAMGSRSACSS